MEKFCKKELCNGCTACVNICPRGCIVMVTDEEGFLCPVINETNCIHCGRCQKVCPLLQEQTGSETKKTVYAAINKDNDIRHDSTSGGVFTLLCQWVLDQNGVVFGAAYDDVFEVVHCKVESADDLHKLRGAKYAQSRLGDVFQQVQACLKEDRYVLFSGTPCQIGGLCSLLGREYEKLILVDLICHGVPSPKVWEHYIKYRSRQDAQGDMPYTINLRSKETGWPGYSIRFEYPNDKTYSALNSQDSYLRGFVGNLYLRPSCYACSFKGVTRQSDFTLGDYWGVWGQLPEYHDGKGTSLVLLHSKKAKQLWNELSQHMRCSEVDVTAALAENPSAIVSSPLTEKRKEFFARYESEDFSVLIDTLIPPKPLTAVPNLLQRVFRKAKRIIVLFYK